MRGGAPSSEQTAGLFLCLSHRSSPVAAAAIPAMQRISPRFRFKNAPNPTPPNPAPTTNGQMSGAQQAAQARPPVRMIERFFTDCLLDRDPETGSTSSSHLRSKQHDESNQMGMTIGLAAEKTSCSVATIRYYEEIGLLGRIGRTTNGRRAYGWPDIVRLRLIRRLRDLGFGIDAVRTLIEAMHSPDSAACLDVRDLALSHVEIIRTKRAELDALEAMLTDLAASCSDACRNGYSPDCRIIEGMSA